MSAGANESRANGWCFTLNNPSEEDILLPQSWDIDSYVYLVYQLEQGESGTPHLQGYVNFGKQVRFNGVRDMFSPDNYPHLETAKGTAKQNMFYCTKEEGRLEGPWEFGVMPEQGKRSDLLSVKGLLDDNVSLIDIARDKEELFGTVIRNQRALNWYSMHQQVQRNWPMEVVVLYGSTGTGKSRSAMERWPGAYWKPRNTNNSNYWDGYNGESTIIVDEFYGWFTWDFLLKLTDRYPLLLDVRYGAVHCSARTIVFTSNKHPKDWYTRPSYPWDESNPLKRRITSLDELTTAALDSACRGQASLDRDPPERDQQVAIDLTLEELEDPPRKLQRQNAFVHVTEPTNLWEIFQRKGGII